MEKLAWQLLHSLLEYGEVNPLKKRSWTYSLNITFTPVAMVTYGNKISAIQNNKTPALASEQVILMTDTKAVQARILQRASIKRPNKKRTKENIF